MADTVQSLPVTFEDKEQESNKVTASSAEEVANDFAENDKEELPEEVVYKHPLQNTWTLWFYKTEKGKTWEENQREITSFSFVEDFWAVFNHLESASNLPSGCDYSLFKTGIKPMWEDTANEKGGRWLLNIDKRQRHVNLDQIWQETLMCLIGEAFEEDCSDLVNGAVINIRNKGDKLAVWTGDFRSQDMVMKIGQVLRSRLAVPRDMHIGFQAHTDTMTKSGSTARNKYVA